jgi:pimeloyl-ACP methyl ester carboxylesterase
MATNDRRTLRFRVATLFLAALTGLVIGVAVDVVRSGGPSGWLARHHLSPPYEARGERVDIGDRSLYLDCRGEGLPTVVLEAGSGGDSSAWSAVLDELASTTRTCAYDRAGRGRSDPAERRTLADAAAELRELLAAAGEAPPYILVAHSLGGAFARVFGADHRDETAGLVLVDTFDPDLQVDWIHPLLGPLRPEYEATLDDLRALVAGVDSLDWPASERQLRAAALDSLPVEVLVAPRYEPRLNGAQNAAIAEAWLAARDSLSPGMVRQTTAWGAGHEIQVDRPDLVIDAARRLIDLARSR